MVAALLEGMLQERWLLWKVGLHNLKMISLWESNFQTGGLAYDNII